MRLSFTNIHYGKTVAISLFFLSLTIIFIACKKPQNQVDPDLSSQMPQKFLWAWERPEDLRSFDPKDFGVAFLAQTITLRGGEIILKKRRQPLDVAPGAYLIAVTRIETVKTERERPTLDEEMKKKIAALVISTLELPDVRGVQTDFDAVVSERNFYRKLMNELAGKIKTIYEEREVRNKASENNKGKEQESFENSHPSSLTTRPSLTMTSLASWCTGDAWFNDFPVDEAVPMAFVMGADSEKIRSYLRNGNDWNEPLCKGSYGISLEEGLLEGMKPGRRTYYFKNNSWKATDAEFLK